MNEFDIIFKINPVYIGSCAQCKYVAIRNINGVIIPILSIDRARGTVVIDTLGRVSVGETLIVSSRNVGCFPSIDDGGKVPLLRKHLADIYNDNVNLKNNQFLFDTVLSDEVAEYRFRLSRREYRFINYIYHISKVEDFNLSLEDNVILLGTFNRASKPITMSSGVKVVSVVVAFSQIRNLALVSGDGLLIKDPPVRTRGFAFTSSFTTDANIVNVMVGVT